MPAKKERRTSYALVPLRVVFFWRRFPCQLCAPLHQRSDGTQISDTIRVSTWTGRISRVNQCALGFIQPGDCLFTPWTCRTVQHSSHTAATHCCCRGHTHGDYAVTSIRPYLRLGKRRADICHAPIEYRRRCEATAREAVGHHRYSHAGWISTNDAGVGRCGGRRLTHPHQYGCRPPQGEEHRARSKGCCYRRRFAKCLAGRYGPRNHRRNARSRSRSDTAHPHARKEVPGPRLSAPRRRD